MAQVQFDNSVFNVKPVPLEMPQNALANALKLAGERQEYETNAFALDNSRQEMARQNALAQILGRGDFNPQTPQGQAELYRAGGVKGAQTFMKGQADIDKVKADAMKTGAETEKVQIEKYFKKLELMGQLMGGVRDQASYDQMRAQAAKIPELADLAPNMPPIYDPQAIEIGQQKAMSVKDRLEARHKELTLAETGRHNLSTEKISVDNNIRTNDTSRANNQASVGATMRGQNMTDARSRESNAIAGGYSSKPMPATALKMQNEALDVVGSASSTQADLTAMQKQIDSGKLSFGPISNAINQGRNMAGLSNEESRNFSSFKSNLEKLRNDSLRLNKGVQTDGDAQRAWNELFQNINDTKLVSQRLNEIKAINARAVDLRKREVEDVRNNYKQAPYDFGTQTNAPAAVGLGGNSPNIDSLLQKYAK